MRISRRSAWLAMPAALALVVSGCSSSSGTNDSGSTTTDAAIVVDGVQPENPLVPGNTNETGGGRVVDVLYTGLVDYATDDAKPQNAIADSIESPDSKVYTIKLKSGWTFHDGTPVNADSFINAWNWVAYSPSGALNSSFMEKIQGYADVHTEDPDGEDGPQKAPTPKTDKMSGLEKVDDQTFKVTLSAPFSTFKASLGYSAFKPLPKSFFDAPDKTAWGKQPVGNGPFKFVSWTDQQEIKLTRFDDYKGTKPKVKDVTFKIYQDQDGAYADLSGNTLDFQQQIPTSAIAGDKWRQDLGDRALERPVLVVQTITFPLYANPKFKDKNFRHALSMAVNRDEITKQIFNSTRQPSKGYTSPAVAGYEETCGEFCTYNPDKAKQLLTQAGGFTGKLTLSYNGDGDHKAWTEAVCNSIKNAVGIDCQATPTATFAVLRQQVNAKKMVGLFRTGWQYDYPAIQNGLEPIYRTGASSNDGGYSNPAFDAALDKAAQAPAADSDKLYAEAEKILVEDMPAIPLWSVKQQSGISTKLKNAKVDAFGNLDLVNVGV
jgi:oligopeptide transport system substrate-binding protein